MLSALSPLPRFSSPQPLFTQGQLQMCVMKAFHSSILTIQELTTVLFFKIKTEDRILPSLSRKAVICPSTRYLQITKRNFCPCYLTAIRSICSLTESAVEQLKLFYISSCYFNYLQKCSSGRIRISFSFFKVTHLQMASTVKKSI